MRNVLLRFAAYISILTICLPGSAVAQDDDGFHENPAHRRDRRPASYTCETAKYLSLSFDGFYRRHDLSGCMHLGQAIESLKSASSLKPDQVEVIGGLLKEARHYCSEDKISRRQAAELVRNAVRVVHNHKIRVNPEPKPDAESDERIPASQLSDQ